MIGAGTPRWPPLKNICLSSGAALHKPIEALHVSITLALGHRLAPEIAF